MASLDMTVNLALKGRQLTLNGRPFAMFAPHVCKASIDAFARGLRFVRSVSELAGLARRSVPDSRPGRRKARRMAARGY